MVRCKCFAITRVVRGFRYWPAIDDRLSFTNKRWQHLAIYNSPDATLPDSPLVRAWRRIKDPLDMPLQEAPVNLLHIPLRDGGTKFFVATDEVRAIIWSHQLRSSSPCDIELIKESVSILYATSICTARVTRLVYRTLYLLTWLLPLLTENGPKQSTPTKLKGGFQGVTHSFGANFENAFRKLRKAGRRFVQLRSFIRIPRKHFYRLENPSKLPFLFPTLIQSYRSRGTKSDFKNVANSLN